MDQRHAVCKKCVLCENSPSVTINADGKCNICSNFECDKIKTPSSNDRFFLESELVKILKKYQGKGEHDCLLMCSGGRDSVAALYYIKKKYHLNPLVLTFDNGFEDDTARKNVENAVEILGVDWIYHKSFFMNDMYREVIEGKWAFPLCPLCSLWYMQLVYDTATKFDLKLIIGGWTRGQVTEMASSSKVKNNQASDIEFNHICKDIEPFIDHARKKFEKYRDFPKNMQEVRDRFKISKKTELISPHWFLPTEPIEYEKLIKDELKWNRIPRSYPLESTNCKLNIIGSWISFQKFGITHFHVEMSKLIRQGKMTKEEAEALLKMDFSKEYLNEILKKINCKID